MAETESELKQVKDHHPSWSKNEVLCLEFLLAKRKCFEKNLLGAKSKSKLGQHKSSGIGKWTSSIVRVDDPIPSLVHTRDTAQMNQMLIKEVTQAEVKRAVFLINPEKSPGRDGFTSQFFQLYIRAHNAGGGGKSSSMLLSDREIIEKFQPYGHLFNSKSAKS
ncbi:conserved hypothetical protein [Ricinus communis]|uniref:Uncharacterized protein n=1 Tax=Ricinus communis TaxID=3988 RepID=B9SCG4_RICCO|nr:conserved hypothetical protein [Ricinus communis]